MTIQDLKEGNSYIVIEKRNSYVERPFKIRVLEITESSLLLKNVDSDNTFRVLKQDFDYRIEVIEHIKEEELPKIRFSVE